VYDRIKESERLLEHLKEGLDGFSYEHKGKQTYFKINVEKMRRSGQTVQKAVKFVYAEGLSFRRV
jgi:hypothetical protein